MQIIGCVGVTCWFNCYFLENYRLCRCNVLIVILRLSNYRLCRCSVLIVILQFNLTYWLNCYLLSKHKLCRCDILIVISLVKCGLCRCSVFVEMLLFASYKLCRCRFVIGMLLLIDYRLYSLLRSNRNIIAWKFQAVLVQCIDFSVLLW